MREKKGLSCGLLGEVDDNKLGPYNAAFPGIRDGGCHALAKLGIVLASGKVEASDSPAAGRAVRRHVTVRTDGIVCLGQRDQSGRRGSDGRAGAWAVELLHSRPKDGDAGQGRLDMVPHGQAHGSSIVDA